MKISCHLLLCVSFILSTHSFLTPVLVNTPTTSFSLGHRRPTATLPSPITFKQTSETSNSLFNARYDGTSGRGLVLFGFVMFLCVWLFSIPPEFRRAYFCSPACEENPIYCNDCVTPKEWVSGIVEYYQNGGTQMTELVITCCVRRQNQSHHSHSFSCSTSFSHVVISHDRLGGVQFDFSIDPKTKRFWEDTL